MTVAICTADIGTAGTNSPSPACGRGMGRGCAAQRRVLPPAPRIAAKD